MDGWGLRGRMKPRFQIQSIVPFSHATLHLVPPFRYLTPFTFHLPYHVSTSTSSPLHLRSQTRSARAAPSSPFLTLRPHSRSDLASLGLCSARPLTPLVQVQSAPSCNTLAIYGPGQTKELTELVPGILNQLGPDSLANLRRLAESYQSMTARQAAMAGGAGGAGAGGEDREGEVGDDDEIPDLVENFDEAGEKKEKASDLEELE
jgi:hypothetical protein